MQDELALSDAELQNAMMLAHLLGDDAPAHAQSLLDVDLKIQYDADCAEQRLFVEELVAQLKRTVKKISAAASSNVRAVSVAVAGSNPFCFVHSSKERTEIRSEVQSVETFEFADPPTRVVGASYACAFVIAAVVNSERIRVPDPLVLVRSSLPPIELDKPVNIGETWLLGAGAVGCAVVWGLRQLPVSGVLHVVDPKKVTDGNLNRQIWFCGDDIGSFKAEALCLTAEGDFSALQLIPHVARFQDVMVGRPIARVLVGLDSREARQDVQRELPREVFDASTTGAQEVVFHYNKLGVSAEACLECVYPTRQDKLQHARHIAEGLGLSLDEVLADFISEDTARKLADRFGLVAESLVGRAVNSIYREQCAAQVLRSADGQQFLAPFCFVSILAGTLLSMHLISRLQGHDFEYNVWPVSAWSPPFDGARERRPNQAGCYCSSSAYSIAVASLLSGDSQA